MIRLQQLRLDALLTIDALAEQTGLAPNTIRRLEQGRGAQMATLARLSTFFEEPASSLLRGTPEFDDQPKAKAA